jgi:hypothetical protein
MIIGYSSLTPSDVRREISAMKRSTGKLIKSRTAARAFLVKAGIMTRAGKLAPRYR